MDKCTQRKVPSTPISLKTGSPRTMHSRVKICAPRKKIKNIYKPPDRQRWQRLEEISRQEAPFLLKIGQKIGEPFEAIRSENDFKRILSLDVIALCLGFPKKAKRSQNSHSDN